MPEPEKAETFGGTKEERVLALARERFGYAYQADYEIRLASLEDLRFTYNVDEGQWPAKVRKEREDDGRPCLTANKLRKFVAIVANQERENRISVKIRPVDTQADPETAKILEDLIRQIEYASHADEIYTNAAEQAAAGGFGYWRLLTRFADDGFDQEIVIEHIENPFSVYMDQRRNYAFITDTLTQAEFEEEYPKAEKIDFAEQGIGEEWEMWYQPGKIRIAEYFAKERVTKKIAQVRNTLGQVLVIELKEGLTAEELEAQGWEVLRQRDVDTHRVKWYKITGKEILEEREWAGKEIPIIEVVGDKVNIEGRIYKRSLIRDGKDPQRMYNFWLTSSTEHVALQPKAPFVVTPQQVSGFEKEWGEANRRNLPYLRYNDVTGKGSPKRELPPQISPGHMQMLQVNQNDIRDTLGMFESFLGEPSNERSGRAIFARQQRSQIGVFHFPDNLRRAITETGRQLIEIIPAIYDTERVIRIRGEKGDESIVAINQTVLDPSNGQTLRIHDLSLGKYDVISDVRQYSTRRQETTELVLQALQYAGQIPQIAIALLALLFRNADTPGAEEVEEIIKQAAGASGGEAGAAGGGAAPGSRPATQPQRPGAP